MRLCFIADAESIHTQKWVNYFAQNGNEAHLISRYCKERPEGLDNRIHLHQLVRILPISQSSIKSILASITFWILQVRYLVRNIKPDILHAHFIGVPGYLGMTSGFHPFVLSAWGSDILIDPKRSQLSKALTSYALKRADRIICVSAVIKEESIRLGAEPKKIETIPFGVDTHKFSPVVKEKAFLKQLGFDDAPVVISTRNLKPIYDVETFIRAIPVVLQEVPEAKFIVGGEGEQRSYLEGLACSLGVAERVKFIGWIPYSELPKYLASSDVYVSTSLSDSLAVSTLEARACGLPTVVGNLPATHEWVTDGEDGFIFPLKDSQSLAVRVIHLLQDEGLRKKFGEAGRKKVVERAEYANQMAKGERLYKELKRVGF